MPGAKNPTVFRITTSLDKNMEITHEKARLFAQAGVSGSGKGAGI